MSSIAAIGILGLSVDLGRVFIVKSETQTYADAAAISAALKLDGSISRVSDAVAAVQASANRANFGQTALAGTVVEFATSANGPWSSAPSPASGYMYARVSAQAEVPLYFLPLVVNQQTITIRSGAVAGQIAKTTFNEGVFPFSPYGHSAAPPDFGLTRGEWYTLRWPANPTLGNNNGNNSNVCVGDRQQSTLDVASAAGGSERGYIEQTSANLIRKTIIDDYQSITHTAGAVVNMTGGAKHSQLSSLRERINQDTDRVAATFSSYRGNGRRVVLVPINDGGTPLGVNNRILGFRAFFLLREVDYASGGNQPWCAEYVGAWVQGSNSQGAGTAAAYVVRLVE